MAWSALARTWNCTRKAYDSLVLRIDDTAEPGYLLRLYDGKTVAAEVLDDSPQIALTKALELARTYLHDDSITEDSLRWVQIR